MPEKETDIPCNVRRVHKLRKKLDSNEWIMLNKVLKP
jgi:hypothetical protein